MLAIWIVVLLVALLALYLWSSGRLQPSEKPQCNTCPGKPTPAVE